VELNNLNVSPKLGQSSGRGIDTGASRRDHDGGGGTDLRDK